MKKATLMALAGALTVAATANVNAQEMKKDGKAAEHCMEMKDGKCVTPKAAEGKCGEGKCGATAPKQSEPKQVAPKAAEGKCGEGKCGAAK